MAKNRNAIVKYGGGTIYYKEVNSYGAQSTNDWTELGYIQSASIKDVTDTEDAQDMTGNTVKTLPVKRVVKVELLLMQTDKTTIDFLKEGCRSNYYSIMIDEGVVDDKTQEAYFGICQLRPQVELASGVRRLPLEITVLRNEYATYLANFDDWEALNSWDTGTYIKTTGGLVFQVNSAGTASSDEPTTRENQTNGSVSLVYKGEYNYPSCSSQTLNLGDILGTIGADEYYEFIEI